ncbi:MAG TPA: metalloregulator ArsR/SmtB family transcription factor [Candidatus Polarisedimenticolaceae bacterium]
MVKRALKVLNPLAGCCPPGVPPGEVPAVADWVPVLKALADETRLQILARLLRKSDAMCVCDIESGFDLSQPTISHHLRLLKDAGLVAAERRGTWVHYTPNREAVSRLARFLSKELDDVL